ncbi:MAG: formylmethanofuran dehydrogenase subunit C [Methylovirgula sp.]
MTALTFTLRASPDQRLDLSALLPHLLTGKSLEEIAALDIATTKEKISVGDVFSLRAGETEEIRFEGGSERFDGIGSGLQSGRIVVAGDVGMDAGRKMSGGELIISGDVGPYAGSCMSGGRMEIAGDAGDFLGGPREGEMQGMSGGVLVLRGSAGLRPGDRLRRGTIVIEGDTGDCPGSRMIAGTLVILGRCGAHPGYLMKRGTIALAKPPVLGATFTDSGLFASSFPGVFAKLLEPESKGAGKLFKAKMRRFSGDMAALGKGEIFVPA